MIDTLVILGSSLTALAVTRDAHAHGLKSIVIDGTAGIAFKSRWVEPVLAATSHREELLAAVSRYGGARSALIATGDDWLRFIVAHRAAIDDAFAEVFHPPNSVLETLLVKSEFSQWCRKNRLPTPRAWGAAADPSREPIEFPVLVRPNETLHSRADLGLPKAIEVRAEDELRDWLDRFKRMGVPAFLSQSLLSERLTQYSVPFARRSGAMLSFVAQKVRPGPRECSQGSFVISTKNADVERLGRLAAERAEYYGIGEVEILHAPDSGRSYIIEINARPWLQYALAPATGNDFLGLMLGTIAEKRADVRRGSKAWINLRNDRIVAFSESTASGQDSRLTFPAYLWSLARSNVYAVFDLQDPRPFLTVAAETLRRLGRRLWRVFDGGFAPLRRGS